MAINPFQAPINYAVDVQSPFEAVLSGFKIGQAGAEAQAKSQALEQAKTAQTELTALFNNPNATAADYARVTPFLPKDQAESVRKSFEMLTAEQQQSSLRNAAQVYSAVKSGQIDIAKNLLKEQATAYRNAGREQDAKASENSLQLIELNPTGAQATVGIMTAILPGGKDLLANVDKALSTIRAEAEGKPTLEKLESDALEAGVKAEFARPLAQANLDKLNKEKLAPSVQEALDFAGLTQDQQKTFKDLQILKKPPGAVTNVNVTNLDKTAAGELGKLVPDLYNQANSAASQLSDIPRYRLALDKAITGPFAEQRLTGAKIANAFGFTGDSGINATREMIQGLSEMALKSRSMMTGQGAITEGEQKLLIKARSGDINFTKGEIQTILNVAERAAKSQYDQSNKLLKSASTQSPTAQMFLDNVQKLSTETPAPASPSPNSVTVGGQTYTRPANFTDAQWNAYKQSVGAR
jgi:hypothetical protein